MWEIDRDRERKITPTEHNQTPINWILILCTLFTFHSVLRHFSVPFISKRLNAKVCVCVSESVHLFTPKFCIFLKFHFCCTFSRRRRRRCRCFYYTLHASVVWVAHTQRHASISPVSHFTPFRLLLLVVLLSVLFYDYDYFSNHKNGIYFGFTTKWCAVNSTKYMDKFIEKQQDNRHTQSHILNRCERYEWQRWKLWNEHAERT